MAVGDGDAVFDGAWVGGRGVEDGTDVCFWEVVGVSVTGGIGEPVGVMVLCIGTGKTETGLAGLSSPAAKPGGVCEASAKEDLGAVQAPKKSRIRSNGKQARSFIETPPCE